MKKALLLLLVVTVIVTSVKAIPASPYPVVFKQPDGTVVTVFIKGDEKVHWRETTDGYTLMFNKEGYLTYAVKDNNGYLQPSNIVATEVESRSAEAVSFLSAIEKRAFYNKEQVSILLQVWELHNTNKSKMKPNETLAGNYKTVCALVQFPEGGMVHTAADFEGLMNEIGYSKYGASGSVKDYFLESSYNQFNLSIILVGPYTAEQSEAYYAGHNGSAKCNDLAKWLAMEADKEIDYSECDHDNDGTVDNFHFVFAGYGQEAKLDDKKIIWSHSWGFEEILLDGKKLSRYSCSPELRGNVGDTITSIGVIAHEISHAFGSPDYYDVNYNQGGQYDGTGKWDLMASGSWNNRGDSPAHHNMYQKMKFGWVKPETLASPTTIINMPNSTENPAVYRVNTTTVNEYFLIENRQNTKFNTYIPGYGLLIHRVHKDIETSTNWINTIHPQKLYPVCASSDVAIPTSKEKSYGVINSTGCPFPGDMNKTEFTDESIPSMKSWAGENTNKPISNITTDGSLTSFDFMGGGNSTEWVPITIISFDNGSLNVQSEGRTIASENYLKNGSVLTITATPNKDYEVKDIKVNNELVVGNTVTVKDETTIVARFQPKPNLINSLDDSNIKITTNNKTIIVANPNSKHIDIEVMDISGCIIKRITTRDPRSTIELLVQGVYIVKISEEASSQTAKVIIR